MDKLAEQLKQDAGRIEARVSDELDRRIEASLHAIEPERPATPRPMARPASFWWASSLTGIAAAIAVIAVLNSLQTTQPVNNTPPPSVANTFEVPTIELKTESAMLTEPLRQELEHLQSDLKKAEEKVKQDMGL